MTKTKTQTIAAMHLNAGDVIMLTDGSTRTCTMRPLRAKRRGYIVVAFDKSISGSTMKTFASDDAVQLVR